MIIADDTQDTPKTTEARLEAQQVGESAQQQQPPPPQYSYHASSPPPPPPPPQMYSTPDLAMMHTQSAGRRFIEAFCVAVLIWFLLGVFTSSLYDAASRHHRYGGYPTTQQDLTRGWPAASDGEVGYCTGSAQWRNLLGGSESNALMETVTFGTYSKSVETSFDLPSSSDLLYLVARGAQLSGSLDILDDGRNRDVVKVDVTIYYYDDSALDRTSICKLKRGDGRNGLGFFTPAISRGLSWRDQIRMQVVVHFPVFSHDGVLHIPAFDTNLPNWSQRLADLGDVMLFHSLSLRSSNAPISSKSVKAREARILTSNSPIEGVYKTDSFLALVTSNGHIKAQVGLYNDDGYNATELVMTTSNSIIESDVSLQSTTSSHRGGSFKSTIKSSNGHLVLHNSEAPVDSKLDLIAKTSNSPATVDLHPAYEGSYVLMTSNSPPSLHVDRDRDDPAGRGRTRIVRQTVQRRGVLQGSVCWEERRRNVGSVSIISTNSPVTLVL